MEDIEDADYVASEHDRLVSAISKLDKTQHITEPTRNEPTNLSSEFNLIKRTNKLNLNNVAKILEDTAHHVQISKKLKKTQSESKVLSKPLEKPQAERIKRATGYEQTKKKVGRWDPVVARSRTVDFVTFPIKHVTTKLEPTGDFLTKLQLKSDLEKELEEVDPTPMVEEEEEEEPVFPMSYEEMVEHRQHLAKMRAQQSYKAAKAKRQSKIKSKKYHRVLKKEKLKQELKEFEELQKKDPEEALKKLEAIEKARALERHTLRHKSTGKWAKNKLIRAKYDKEVRQQLADQLAVGRGLTKKVQDIQSTDDEADDEATPDISLAQDPMNPWMLQRSDKSNVNAEFDFGYKKFVQNKMNKNKDDSDSDSNDDDMDENDISNDLSVLKARISNLSQGNLDEESSDDDAEEIQTAAKPEVVNTVNNITIKAEPQQIIKEINSKAGKTLPKKQRRAQSKSKTMKPVATSNWEVETVNENESKPSEDILSAFENHETSVAQKVEKKLKEMRRNIERLENASRASKKGSKRPIHENDTDNLEYLKLKNKKVKAVIDEELIETSSKTAEGQTDYDKDQPISKIINADQAPVKESADSNIDPNRFIEVKPKYLNSAISQGENEYDQLDDDQVVPRVNIEEVFEEDDVVASFRQEKEDEINKDKPEDINLTLPGWGAWGGKGVKPQKRKRNRFILKAPPKMPRRDENKGDIIIKEYKDPKLAVHKVKDVPFPFESVKDYEASIRAPLGNTFIPEKAHKKLIRPSVITKAGKIIEPMDEEELLLPKNKSFKNEAVIRLLGKK
uniref:U3 small nucleolar RNA-associated protein 14 homolog A n=1 Tax=Heliothis virescens TaxID=7102 RepID=A0A2A4K1T4_HELVI